jgi:hypothetical protein
MPASHFDVKPMTGRPKFIVRHSTNFDVGIRYIRVNEALAPSSLVSQIMRSCKGLEYRVE